VRLAALAIVLVACEPAYDGTAFKCDDGHGCPLDQSCIASRCRRVAPVAIECGDETCGPTEQCCADVITGDRCIGAAEVCPGDTALCDGKDDCLDRERCCNGDEETTCALACDSTDVACASDADCPSDAIHCCPQPIVPWGSCRSIGC
jgi:hypothetical protein